MLPLLGALGLYLGTNEFLGEMARSREAEQNKSYTDFVNNLIQRQTQGSMLPGTQPDPNQQFTQGLMNQPQGQGPMMPQPEQQGIMSQLPIDPMQLGQGLLADRRTANLGAQMMGQSWDRGGAMERLQAELAFKERMAAQGGSGGSGMPDIKAGPGEMVVMGADGIPELIALPGSARNDQAKIGYQSTQAALDSVNKSIEMLEKSRGTGTWGADAGTGKALQASSIRALADAMNSQSLQQGEFGMYQEILPNPADIDVRGKGLAVYKELQRKLKVQKENQIKRYSRWPGVTDRGPGDSSQLPPGFKEVR